MSDTRAWKPETRRTTRIENNELKAWFNAVIRLKQDVQQPYAPTVADYLLLLILTGLRRSEAATLKWDDVNLANRTFTVRDTKNHEDHTLPLSDFLHDLLAARKEDKQGEYVFPGHKDNPYLVEPRNYVRQVIEQSGVTFTLHDLRRTFLTIAESLDIPAYALKRLVNHSMRHDVTAGYIIIDVERLRQPMQKVTDYLLSVSDMKQPSVINLNPEGVTHG